MITVFPILPFVLVAIAFLSAYIAFASRDQRLATLFFLLSLVFATMAVLSVGVIPQSEVTIHTVEYYPNGTVYLYQNQTISGSYLTSQSDMASWIGFAMLFTFVFLPLVIIFLDIIRSIIYAMRNRFM